MTGPEAESKEKEMLGRPIEALFSCNKGTGHAKREDKKRMIRSDGMRQAFIREKFRLTNSCHLPISCMRVIG